MKKATSENIDLIIKKANEKPYNNFFIIGDIELYWKKNHAHSFLYYEGLNNVIDTIYFVYYNTLLIYTTAQFDTKSINKLLKHHHILNVICHDSFSQNEFIKYTQEVKISILIKKEDILVMKKLPDKLFSKSKLILEEKIEKLLISKSKIKEFAFMGNKVENEIIAYKEKFKNKTFFSYYIEQDDKVVAAASCDSWTDKVASIGGVFCLEEYRQKNYASDCVYNLCKHIIEIKKLKPILFFDNPVAKIIYEKLGFEFIDSLFVNVIKN
ncbi:GNAT family N-acetyltransferase [Mycoplasma crocodyli]|uniref:Acetyltransferase, GNAT family n=1 Tax=Mycoplasma crocodyli (strain ATCC 51981 / MP145) TaxID=512564 RepID=D5E5Z3_MYCCM|nr:GNAT family N-acetyltransferase [Mycoplasma crocodyli]ADE19934.1 acetyltransferase, GNAT family [Mycoplasma crocodyli MP145]